MNNQQIPLAIHLNDEATLADFSWQSNPLLAREIQQTLAGLGERFLFIWGRKGAGKSHLLQACCSALGHHHQSAYLPLELLKEWGREVLEGLEEHYLVTLDDIDAIAGDLTWEESLFHLYNRLRDNNQILMVSAEMPPAQLPLKLPDLKSRLCSGLIIHLHELDDEEKMKILMNRAHQRGFVLPQSVAQYLVNRHTRNMHDLLTILDQLDEASLAAQRKITIPFVKEILNR